jgi:Lipid-droplet associated hydrolase
VATAHLCFSHATFSFPDTRRRSCTHPLFRSGNPGLLDFYVPFLNAIHRATVSESSDSHVCPSSSSSVTIFAHAHLGLSSYIGTSTDGASFPFPETSSVALPAQIEAHLEFLDVLLAAYGGHRDSYPATRVLLVGHSIGAWFVQELLKARAAHWQLRTRLVLGAYLLFPTISHIGRSPCGRTLSVCVLAPKVSILRIFDTVFFF